MPACCWQTLARTSCASSARPPQRRARDGAYWDVTNRSRPSVGVNLKDPDCVALVLELVEQADALIEGFRPGVAERLGLGPDDCFARNTRLVYGRMTGWGQEGPYADAAGHDIDYIAIAGALGAIGRAGEPPLAPLNLIGDFGGGGMMLAFGVSAALLSAARTGQGQVVDAAMLDGGASLMTMIHAFKELGMWKSGRGTNILDSGAHFYECYETKDGEYVALGAIEPQFYAALIKGMGLEGEELPNQMDRERWPEMKKRFAEIFLTKTQDEWSAIFDGTDACVVPVLDPFEAYKHPHNQARQTFVEVEGIIQPAPAPRFLGTPSSISRPPGQPGADTEEGLAAWGVDRSRIASLKGSGALELSSAAEITRLGATRG